VPGTLAQLTVTQFSTVEAGATIAHVIAASPRVLESSLAAVKAEVEWLRVSADSTASRERNRLDYERLRLNLLDQRALLAAHRVQLQFAEAELGRVSLLHQGGTITNIASQTEFEIASRDRDALRAQIEERQSQIVRIENDLLRLRTAHGTNAFETTPDTLQAAIDLQEKRLRLVEAELSPITLTAPISGTVSAIYRRAGENVVAGEPILVITASEPERIVGYLLPPLAVEPTVGMSVTVRARTLKREVDSATVTEVGAFMDAVPPVLVGPVNSGATGLNNRGLDANNRVLEVGLPIAVSLPPALKLRPGELVDVALDPQRR
jgi:multidrug resistance efflux pump